MIGHRFEGSPRPLAGEPGVMGVSLGKGGCTEELIRRIDISWNVIMNNLAAQSFDRLRNTIVGLLPAVLATLALGPQVTAGYV